MIAPVKVGDRRRVRHTCNMVDHVKVLTVTAVVPLNTGDSWRVETVRCDGSALHMIVDRKGRESGLRS